MNTAHRLRGACALVLASASSIACASSSESELSPDEGTTSSALWSTRLDEGGGLSYAASPDMNTPEANAVVAVASGGRYPLPVERCTGTLVSWRHVLTSRTCAERHSAPSSLPYVYFGSSEDGQGAPAAPIQAAKVVVSDGSADLAVLVLRAPAPTGAVPASLSLEPLASSEAGPLGGDCYGIANGDGLKAVGWSPRDASGSVSAAFRASRQAHVLRGNDVCVAREQGDAAGLLYRSRYFSAGAPRNGLAVGDEGGPLFARRTRNGAGLWDLIGVAHRAQIAVPQKAECVDGDEPRCDAWMDLLQARTRQWLQSAPELGASACDVERDQDCDGWFTFDAAGLQRDNCPNSPNPDQHAAFGAVSGSACDTGPKNADSLRGTWRGEANGVQLTLSVLNESGQPTLRLLGASNTPFGRIEGRAGGPLEIDARSLRVVFNAQNTDGFGRQILGRYDGKSFVYRAFFNERGEPTKLELKAGGEGPWTFVRAAQ